MAIRKIPAYYIKFKLKDGSIKFFREETGLVNTLISATKYQSRDDAQKIAGQLMGLPRVVKIPTNMNVDTKNQSA